MPQLKLEGIIPPLVTAFAADGSLDSGANRDEIRHMLDAGVDGLTLGGSTGEGNTLSPEEACDLAGIAVQEAAGKVPVICGIIADSTREVVLRGRALKTAGADALQVTPPHYLFSSGEQGFLSFYSEIVDQVGLPIVIYNVVPWNTVTVPTLIRLGEIPGVVAVKQSGGDIHKLADLLQACERAKSPLRVLSAVDALLYPTFVLGAHGAVAGVLAVAPELGVSLWRACATGDHSTALSLHKRLLPIWRILEAPDFPARAKAALEIIGRPRGNPRSPLLRVSEEVRAEIEKVLLEADVIAPAGTAPTRP